MRARLILTACFAAGAASPAIFHRDTDSSGERAPAITLRKRLHVNPLIAEPDTLDIEWGSAFSWDGSFTFPMAIHFTPEGHHAWWGRTEFGVAFDSLSSNEGVHFGDRATFAATCVLRDGEKLDIAIVPAATVLMRGDSGFRAGATAIARYDVGRSSAGVTFGWSGATRPSPSNPAGTFDIGAGYGFRLMPSGPLGHLTPHVNWLWEKSTGIERQISIFEGVEYQITDPVAVDFALQHISLWGGAPDRQFVIGLTVNTGRLHKH
jgi:hypothetical protein